MLDEKGFGVVSLRSWLFAVVSAAVLAALPATAVAAVGDLDQSFGTGGKTTSAIGTGSAETVDVARHSSGMLYVAGSEVYCKLLLTRYTAGGTLDQTFNSTGYATLGFPSGYCAWGYAVAVQGDKVLVAGMLQNGNAVPGTSQILVARFLPTGQVDPDFGDGGTARTTVHAGGNASASDIKLDPQGRILVAGSSSPESGAGQITVARYSADGVLDAAFGSGGIATVSGTATAAAEAVALAGEKIVTAGWENTATGTKPAVHRFNADGTLDDGTAADTTPGDEFGTAGRADTLGSGSAYALVVQADGKLGIAGQAGSAYRIDRLTPGGEPDGTFGTNGTTTFSMGQYSGAYDIAEVGGKLLAAGRSYDGNGYYGFGIARLTTTGVLDTGFSGDGKAMVNFHTSGKFTGGVGLVVDEASGRGIVGGFSPDSASRAHAALAAFTVTVAKPLAATVAATGVGSSGATLRGTVNPRGSATTTHFEYGPTGTGMSQRTADVGAGAASAEAAVQAAVTGLASSTAYEYRFVAVNDGGTTVGDTMTFTTAEAPPGAAPDAVTLPPTQVEPDRATLRATVVPNGFATTYRFKYGTTAAYGSETPVESAGAGATGLSVSKLLTGLSPKTTYHYTVVADSANGRDTGEDQTFTTPAWKPVLGGYDAPVIKDDHADVRGTVDPRGTPTTYHFEYGLDTAYARQTAPQSAGAGNGAVAAPAQLTALLPNRTYHYRLVATNEGGRVEGPDQTFVSDAGLPVVGNGSNPTILPTAATFRAEVDQVGATASWNLELGTSREAVRSIATGTLEGTGRREWSLAYEALSPNTTYHWRLIATNRKGTTVGPWQVLTTQPVPPPPAGDPVLAGACALDIGWRATTLIGSVNPNGRPTSWSFETRWGLPATLTNHWPSHDLVSGHEPALVYEHVTTLGDQMGFTLTADNLPGAGGETKVHGRYGLPPFSHSNYVGTCPQGGRMPESAGGAPTGVGKQKMTLHGTVDPNGEPTVAKFQVYSKSGTPMDLVWEGKRFVLTGDSPVGVHAEVKVWPNSSYGWRLVATNRAGTTHKDINAGWTTVRTATEYADIWVGAPGVTYVSWDDSTVTGTITIDPRAVARSSAKRRAKKAKVIGKVVKRNVDAGQFSVFVPLKAAARKALRKRKRVPKATLTLTVTPPKGKGKPVVTKSKVKLMLGKPKKSGKG